MTDEETKILVRLDEKVANLFHIAERNEAGIKEIREDQAKHREAVTKLSDAVTGNGTKGLCDRMTDLEIKHDKLQRVFWIIVGSLVASGAIGTGIYEITKALG